jgi:hypothetical protein
MHRLVERLDHAVDGVEPAAAIGERTDAGQYHAIRRGTTRGSSVTTIG